jgi:hypothetical protein
MTSKKERHRRRRHAERELAAAWAALDDGNPVLAERASRRALETGFVNPRMWREHGLILLRCGKDAEGEEALRRAIALAPQYADAFADLARVQATRGKLAAAARLQQRVVELRPDSAADRALWDEWRAHLPPAEEPDTAAGDAPPFSFTQRTARFDWDVVLAEVRAKGAAVLAGLLEPQESAALVARFGDEAAFEFEERRDDELEHWEARMLRAPLPGPLPALRAELRARAAAIASALGVELGWREQLPVQVPRKPGARSAVGLVRYPPRGQRAPRGGAGHGFPLALEVDLGPGPGTSELLLDDVRPGRRVHVHRFATAAGDGVLFCSRERLVMIAGVAARQPVRAGRAVSGGAARFVLELPFEDVT